eukprot:COSAG02_NODE_3014_length_7551_cov_83.019995_7_plen_190_part_00
MTAVEPLSPTSVSRLLADPNTRITTIDQLEAHAGPHEAALALAAAPALTDLLCLDASEVEPALFQRVGLLRARLIEEASDLAAAWGAAHADGRYAMLLRAPNVVSRVCSEPVAELEIEDAMSYACGDPAPWYAAGAGGIDAPVAAAGMSMKDFGGVVHSAHPVLSRSARRPVLQLDGGPRMSCQCGRGI